MSENKFGRLSSLPRAPISQLPTALEELPNLGKTESKAKLFVKRDDCTGLALGGNKARQLEFYIGEALEKGADTILITGAVQSNFVRMAAAGARKAGMDCHIQLEARVQNNHAAYNRSGNVLLSQVLGATLHHFDEGEDEAGADIRLEEIAEDLISQGKKPYVIHLALGHPPLGALGYVVAARELLRQLDDRDLKIDEIVIASGSGATHSGMLFGLRTLGSGMAVKGICVRRDKKLQFERIRHLCEEISVLLGVGNCVGEADIELNDDFLAPGYGKVNDAVLEAIELSAHKEGLLLDPVYTGRVMAGFLERARNARENQNLLFVHTGGQPAIFGYEMELQPILSNAPR